MRLGDQVIYGGVGTGYEDKTARKDRKDR